MSMKKQHVSVKPATRPQVAENCPAPPMSEVQQSFSRVEEGLAYLANMADRIGIKTESVRAPVPQPGPVGDDRGPASCDLVGRIEQIADQVYSIARQLDVYCDEIRL